MVRADDKGLNKTYNKDARARNEEKVTFTDLISKYPLSFNLATYREIVREAIEVSIIFIRPGNVAIFSEGISETNIRFLPAT